MATLIRLIKIAIFFVAYFLQNSSTISAQNFTYTQMLDHFGVGSSVANIFFEQRYMVDATHWAGLEKNGPILVFLGGEAPIDRFLLNIGIITESAPRLQALVVYIEHRFYGSSVPFGSIDFALRTPDIRSCLNSEQALADYADIIIGLKANLSASNSAVIVIGGSYSGMLAAWFRLKYPHIATGALASSAPIFFSEILPEQNQYCSIVDRDFLQVNLRCHDMIRESWALINEIGSHSDGLAHLNTKFNLCRNLASLDDLKDYLIDVYSFSAQYNGIGNHFINKICDAIVRSPDRDVLAGISRAIGILHEGRPCYDLDSGGAKSVINILDPESQKAWNFQVCTEIIQRFDFECTGDNKMFPTKKFDIDEYKSNCWLEFGVFPRPHWASTYYGGQV